MAKLHFHSLMIYFISFTTIINVASAARTLETPTRHRHHNHHKLSFLMKDVLNDLTHHSSSKFPTTKPPTQFPFSKPLGFFPPNGGIAIPEIPATTTTRSSMIGISFPARVALQELEYGMVREINEELFESKRHKLGEIVGRIEGLCVENSEENDGHMLALTMYFDNKKDGFRLFGVFRSDYGVNKESHVAIIGGFGKYLGANGYATLKRTIRTNFGGNNYNKFIEFHVYLSK